MSGGVATSAADASAVVAESAAGTFPPPRVVAGFALMALGMFMAMLDIQIVAASLPQIQAGLAAGPDEVSWIQTSYLVAEVVMIPLSGFLMRAFSIRYLFAASAAGFVVTSALCATATSIEEMIVYRALQGFVGGAMIPTTYAASFQLFPRRYQTQVTVAVALLITLAPTIGPTLGGWLTDAFAWEAIFLINIAPGVLCVFGVLALVDLGKPDLALLKRIDVVGLVLMAFFLMGLDFVLEEGSRDDWFESRLIAGVAVVAAFAGVGFLWRALAARAPIVDLSPFANRNFAAGCLLQLALGAGLFGLTYMYPLFLGRIGGLSAGQVGTTVYVTGLTMLLSAPVIGRIARSADPRLVCSAGFLFLAASCWTTQPITAQWRFDELLVPQVLRGLGLMCGVVSTSVIAFATLTNAEATRGSPLITLMRNLGGALGLALINTALAVRFDLHWARLGESLDPGRPVVARALEIGAAQGELAGLDPERGVVAALARIVAREASVMSYADAFTILAWLFAGMALLPLLLRRPPTFDGAKMEG